MIKLISASLLAALALTLAPAAEARKGQIQDIDFGAITCKAFLNDLSTASEEDAGAIFLWLDGYLSGVSGDTSLDWKDLEKFSTNLVAYCGKKPDEKVLDAAEAVGIAE